MASQAHGRRPRDPLGAEIGEQAVAESNRRRQVRRAIAETADRPRPLEFDARGFPIAQRNRTSAERVAWLLNPPHPEPDWEEASCPTSTAPAAG
jgi:hypothetical protein